MIRRPMTLLAAGLLALSMLAVPAAAHADDTPLHAHVLIQRPAVEMLTVEADVVLWDGPYLTGFRRCVDMPVTPLQGHHANVHRGPGGAGLANAGHWFVPTAPLSDLENCAELEWYLAEFGPVPLEGPPPSDN